MLFPRYTAYQDGVHAGSHYQQDCKEAPHVESILFTNDFFALDNPLH